MKTFSVPVVFQCWGTVEVEAENKKDLLRKLKDRDFVDLMLLPEEWDYVEDSYEIDFDNLEEFE